MNEPYFLLTLFIYCFKLLSHLRNCIKQICNKSIISNSKNRCFGILIDSDNCFGVLHSLFNQVSYLRDAGLLQRLQRRYREQAQLFYPFARFGVSSGRIRHQLRPEKHRLCYKTNTSSTAKCIRQSIKHFKVFTAFHSSSSADTDIRL